ncbi:hypothetical protein DPMN_026744 [Dreissena polymorpha]|uniref:Uncharacterized protein n=1 Tax=Dreissena polymorpha TaxID=45954 RepID=A0A9D4REW6_DREPO|nr:hypothetical protein DPMN_026744 [Dreissena polymorpha]
MHFLILILYNVTAAPAKCKGSITPSFIEGPGPELRKFVFDKEKIITSMRITLTGPATEPTPAFKVAYARACNFDMGQFVKENDQPKVGDTTEVHVPLMAHRVC